MATGRVMKVSRAHRAVAGAASILVAVGLLLYPGAAPQAQAANGSDFLAGNIISDAVFFDGTAMDEPQIQQFLNAQVPNCAAGYTCLKDFSQSTESRAADAFCSAYTGVQGQSAADIIWNVARTCGVNAQVLLVLLQKEQSLVSSTAPSPGRYTIATGYGCPDTAPCDSQYYGFFNQVYRAARQFRIYQARPNDYNHRAGQVNQIRFSPNAQCGSSPVFIENQATAGLYNYTPYQPNGAAVGNLYGTGDGCSSYGNRNFWRIFTDWFGNPQGGTLVRTATDPRVYLITDTGRYSISSANLYSSLAALGPARTVSQTSLDSRPLLGEASNLLRDSSTGDIFLAAYGAKNRFGSCAMVERWGFGTSCGRYIDVSAGQLSRFTTGGDLTQFARSTSTFTIHHIDAGKKRKLHSWSQVIAVAAGAPTTYADVPQPTLDMLSTGPDYLDPGTVVRTSTDDRLYLANGNSSLVPISTGNVLSAFGLGSRITIVTPASIAAAAVSPDPLSVAITCGSEQYIAGGGVIWKIAIPSGLAPTVLDASTCATLTKATKSVTGATLLLNQSSAEIFHITGGRKQYVADSSQLAAINGSNPLVLIPATAATLTSIPTNIITLPVARLVKSAASSTVYLVDGGSKKISIPSFALAAEFGITGYSVVSSAALDGYSTSTGQLRVAVSCGGSDYIAGEGQLWRVPSTHGLTPTSLDPATCAALTTSPSVTTGVVLMLQRSTGAIYLISEGKRLHLRSMEEIVAVNGANPLVLIPATDATIAGIPVAPVPVTSLTSGTLVKSPSSSAVYFVDGSRKLPLPSFALAAEYGVTGFSTVSDATMTAYPIGPSFTIAATCSGSPFIAGGGARWSVPTTAGLPTTALDAATCARLPVSPQPVTGAVFLRLASGEIYYVSAGIRQFVTSMARVTALNGSAPLVLIPVSSAVLSTIPSGPNLN